MRFFFTTPLSGKGKYDVNGDGFVDVKNADGLSVAVATGITDAKVDLNASYSTEIRRAFTPSLPLYTR